MDSKTGVVLIYILGVPAQNVRDTKTIVMCYCVNTLKFEITNDQGEIT